MNTSHTAPSIASDTHSLNSIREQGLTNNKAAIKAAAKEFEAFFMNMMLKSMRQASEVIGDDSMFSSSQEKMFVGMLDEQMSVELSQKGNLGIADLLVRDLIGENKLQSNKFKRIDPLREAVRPATNENSIKVKQSISAGKVDINEKSNVLNESENIGDELNSNSIPNKPIEIDKQLPEKRSLFDNAADFVDKLLPIAKKVAEKIGVDPRMMLAQAALETGWGQYIMHDAKGAPSHNLFGIKSHNEWKGNSVRIDTLEVENNEIVQKKDGFRMYDSFEQSFNDFISFIKSNPRYQKTVQSVSNAKEFISELQNAGYATDPNYAKKVISIFERMPLQDNVME